MPESVILCIFKPDFGLDIDEATVGIVSTESNAEIVHWKIRDGTGITTVLDLSSRSKTNDPKKCWASSCCNGCVPRGDDHLVGDIFHNGVLSSVVHISAGVEVISVPELRCSWGGATTGFVVIADESAHRAFATDSGGLGGDLDEILNSHNANTGTNTSNARSALSKSSQGGCVRPGGSACTIVNELESEALSFFVSSNDVSGDTCYESFGSTGCAILAVSTTFFLQHDLKFGGGSRPVLRKDAF